MIKVHLKKTVSGQLGNLNLDFNFEIDSKSIALLGESGAGKTTLLRMIAGVSQPDSGFIEMSGRVFFDSERKINLKPQERNVGFVFQDYALFPNMTVEQNITFSAPKEVLKDEIENILSLNRLAELKKKYPHELSGGQKQRVALVRALMRKPQVLLLDEPLSALDFKTRADLQSLLKTIIEANAIENVILVSHDLDEIKKLTQKCVQISEGQIVSIQPSLSLGSRAE